MYKIQIDKSKIENKYESKKIFSKSLAINKDLPKNHKIKFDDLESKKPGMIGIDAASYKKIIGRKLKKKLKKHSFLKINHFL